MFKNNDIPIHTGIIYIYIYNEGVTCNDTLIGKAEFTENYTDGVTWSHPVSNKAEIKRGYFDKATVGHRNRR